MSMWIYLFICLAIFAFGDAMGVATKAKMSSVFVALIIFLIGFLTGILPKDIIDQAALNQIAKWSSAFLVFHMGTGINIAELKREWKTVVMSIVAMGVAIVSIFAVAPIIGTQAAAVSIPIVNGGIVATQIMTEAAMTKGLPLVAALGTIIYAIQKFVGTPPASFFGLKEANELLADFRKDPEKYRARKAAEEKGKGPKLYKKYEKYFTDYTCLAVTALFALISQEIGAITGISYSIWALILGIVMGCTGVVPPKILEKGKSSGLISMAIFASIIPSLASINVGDLKLLGFQTVVVFVAVMVGTILFLYVLPGWKICGSKNLAVGISMAQLLGFPATFLISNEIATAVSQTEEEKELVLSRIQPAYVIAGFASVTSISIIIAGIFVKFL